MKRLVGVLLSLLVLAAPAGAEVPAVPDPFASGMRPAPSAMGRVGPTTFMAGDFTHVGARASNGFLVDTAAGAVAKDFEIAGSAVYAAIPDGAGGWWIGGGFERVLGQPRANLAHVLADGTLGPSPDVSSAVHSLGLSADGKRLVLGGGFSQVAGTPRRGLAVLDVGSGQLVGTDPGLVATQQYQLNVNDIVVVGSDAYVAGAWDHAGGRRNLLRISLANGVVAAFDPEVNGEVTSLAHDAVNSKLYLAGAFTEVNAEVRERIARINLPSGNNDFFPVSPNSAPRDIAYDAARKKLWIAGGYTQLMVGPSNFVCCTGLAVVNTDPVALDNQVHPTIGADGSFPRSIDDIALDGSGGAYLVGDFMTVDGVPRADAASVSATGAIGAWNPGLSGNARVVATGGGQVFVGGAIGATGAQRRARLALFDSAGTLLGLNPGIASIQPAPFNDVAPLPDGSGLLVGGSFTAVAGEPRDNLAMLLPTGGVSPLRLDVSGIIFAIAVAPDGKRAYISGDFNAVDGQPRPGLAAIDLPAGTLSSWQGFGQTAPAAVSDVAVSGDSGTVYVSGTFSKAGTNDQDRYRLAALSAVDGTATSFDAAMPVAGSVHRLVADRFGRVHALGQFEALGGQPRSRYAVLDGRTGAAAGPDLGLDAAGIDMAVTESGRSLVLGGYFSAIGGVGRERLAAIDLETLSLTGWNPGADHEVTRVQFSGGTLFVRGQFETVAGQYRPAFALFTIPPENTAAPTVSRSGEQLTCSTGSWLNNPNDFTRQWRRDGRPVAGATGAEYTIDPGADGSRTITCAVTAGNAGGSATAVSAGVAVADTIAPLLRGAKLWKKRFKVARRVKSRATEFRFNLSEAAKVTITIKRCPPKKKNRKRGKCSKKAGSLAFAGKAGANQVPFSGRFSKRRRLRPGNHAAELQAVDAAGNASARVVLKLVVRPN